MEKTPAPNVRGVGQAGHVLIYSLHPAASWCAQFSQAGGRSERAIWWQGLHGRGLHSHGRYTVKKQSLLLTLLLFAWVAVHAGCGGNDEIIPFTLVTPEGQETFAGVERVRLSFGDKTETKSISGPGASFELEMKLKKGGTSPVVLEGLSSDDGVLCRGQTPVVNAYPTSQTLILFVSRVGTFGRAPVEAPVSATAMAMANYSTEYWDGSADDDLSTTIWFGGLTSDATVAAVPFYYDSYFHDTYTLPELPLPRAAMTAMNIDGAYFLIFGGFDEAGAISGRLDLMQPGALGFEYLPDVDMGLEPGAVARADGVAVTLGPYPSLLQGFDHRLLNSFLVVGGRGPGGPLCDYLHLVASYHTSTYDWSISGELRAMVGCRLGRTATRTETSSSTSAAPELVVLIYGGGGPGDPVAETVRISPDQPDVDTVDWGFEEAGLDPAPGPMISGHTATRLSDRRILILGGVTSDGSVLADGLIYDPDDDSFTILPGLLRMGRFGHSATLLGDELVVAGGTGADGQPLPDAEVFDVGGEEPRWVASPELVVPRTGHMAFPMPTGTMGIMGGTDAAGEPVRTIEIYTPGLVD